MASGPSRRARIRPLAGSLQGEDGEGARDVVAAVSAAAAGEQPEALGVQAPDRGVDQTAPSSFSSKV